MNTQTQEALHKALKVLNCLNNDRVYETAWVKGAINACKEALAKPSVAQLNNEYLRDTHVEGLQPAQEPIHNCPNCNSLFTKEIYSTPAPAWKGLSDDEVWDIVDGLSPFNDSMIFARTIEQALKEKNT